VNQESCASSRGSSFKSGLLEYTVSIVSKQSHTNGSETDPLRKEAGFKTLVTTILISSDSIRMAWCCRNRDGESRWFPFCSNTADTVCETSTVIFWPKVNFQASLIFKTTTATAHRHLGHLLLTLSSCLEK